MMAIAYSRILGLNFFERFLGLSIKLSLFCWICSCYFFQKQQGAIMADESVIVSVDKAVMHIQLSRPDKKNAINLAK